MFGLFAGRGDTIIGFLFALLIGIWIGWQLRGLWLRIRSR